MGSNQGKMIEDEITVTMVASDKPHSEGVNCMTISDDKSLIVTGSDDKSVKMWSTTPFDCIGIMEGHESSVSCVTTNENYILSGSYDYTIRKWDMTTCDCLYIYKGHTSRISRIICTGDVFFSSSYDKTARAWNFHVSSKEACLVEYRGHSGAVIPMIFISGSYVKDKTPNFNSDDILLTGSADRTVRSWSVSTGVQRKVFQDGHAAPISCMVTDETGKMLYTGGADGAIVTWDIKLGIKKRVMKEDTKGITSLLIQNRMLYSASQNGAARAWVREFGDCIKVFKGSNSSAALTSVKFSTGYIYTSGTDSMVRCFESNTGKLVMSQKVKEGAIECMIVIEDNKGGPAKIFVGTNGGDVIFITGANPKKLNGEMNYSDDEEVDQTYYNRQKMKQERHIKELEERLNMSYSDSDF